VFVAFSCHFDLRLVNFGGIFHDLSIHLVLKGIVAHELIIEYCHYSYLEF
jgi:hypothetical protein